MDSKIVFDGMGNVIERNGVAIGSNVPLKKKDAVFVMRSHLEKRIRNSDFAFIDGATRTVEYYDNGERKVLTISSRKKPPESLSQKKETKLQCLLAEDFVDKIKFIGFAGAGAWYQNGTAFYEIY